MGRMNSCLFARPSLPEIGPGDTLFKIAREQGVTAEGIMALIPVWT